MKKAKKLFAKADAKIEAALTKLKRRQSRRLDARKSHAGTP
jgi:hypothetical protein